MKNIVILTGAGISKESGLDTFRDADGIWQKYRVEDVATPDAFERDPVLVHEFYNQRRSGLLSPAIQPNAAHTALARLEREWTGGFMLATQNIDDLHERAGSQRVVHMHGELRKAECALCGHVCAHDGDLSVDTPCPSCGHAAAMRPHVVSFGEYPRFTPDIERAINRCAIYIAIGTSGTVYPAANYVRRARERALARTIEVNLEPSASAEFFDEALHGPASQTVPALVEKLLSEQS